MTLHMLCGQLNRDALGHLSNFMASLHLIVKIERILIILKYVEIPSSFQDRNKCTQVNYICIILRFQLTPRSRKILVTELIKKSPASVQRRPLLVRFLRQMNPVHIITSYFFEMHLMSSIQCLKLQSSLPFRFSGDLIFLHHHSVLLPSQLFA
jgi:hypothetical protein